MVARGLGLVAIAFVLAACGGGGGGSSGSSGGGGSVGAATPQGFTLPAGSSKSTVIAEEGAESGSPVVRYTSSGSATVTFGGVTKTRTWRGTPIVIGDVDVTESNDGRTVVVTARGETSSLQYTNYGVWLESSATTVLTSASSRVTGVSTFVIGDATPVAAMPNTGSASYRGQAVAVELRGAQTPRTSSGPFNANVDFATSSLNATADLTGAGFGRVTMTGLTIDDNQFSGSATTASHAGSVKGGFAGPEASELGGTFALTGPSTVHGAFAARSR